MGGDALPARVTVPGPPASYVPRERLDRRWDEWSDKRIVLVTAGAGFGKTAFLAANARASARPCRWYSFDRADRDLVTFGGHLREAVGVGADVPAGADVPDSTAEARPGSLLADVVGGLRRSLPDGVLVLDDAHLVGGSPPVLRFLERLLDYLPERLTLVLSAREPIDVPTMRRRALGVVDAIGPKELRFDADEIAVLFERHFPGGELPAASARRIAARTEGWPAGVEIFLQALESPAAEAIRRTLDGFGAAGEGWFGYFAEEVLSRIEESQRDFLLRSSVLPRLAPDLCDRVLGREDSRTVLADLCRRHLFTFRDESEGEGYRYHHLFRDFLRDRLARSAPPAEVRRLHGRAAAALRRIGAPGDALLATAATGDAAATLALVERHGEKLLEEGRVEIVRGALDTIPQARLNRSARALTVYAAAREIPGEWKEAERLYRRARKVARPGAERAEIVARIAQIRMRLGDFSGSVALGNEALAEPGRKSARLRGRVLDMLGICACEMGELEEGERHLRAAVTHFRRSRDREAEIRAFYLLPGNIHYRRGDFQRAKEAARRALVEFRRRGDLRRTCHCLGVLAHVTAEAAEESSARELAREALRLAERLDYPVMDGYGHLALGRCDWLAGDWRGAREHVEIARRRGEELGETGLVTIPVAWLAGIARSAGEGRRASRLAAEAWEIARNMKDPYQQSAIAVLRGELEADEGRLGAARVWWRKAEQTIRQVGMEYEKHRLLLARLDTGDVPEKGGEAILGELVAGAARLEHGFLFLRVDPDRAARVLPRALRLDADPAAVEGWLARLGASAVPGLRALLDEEEGPARARAIGVLARIGGDEARAALADAAAVPGPAGQAARAAARELATVSEVPLRLRALGPFELRIGDRRLAYGDWKSARALRLFQLLAVHRFRWIPRDEVLEALWPDAEPDRALNNLRQTVHLLRRLLDPDGKRSHAGRWIRFHDDAYRLDPGAAPEFDVEDLEARLGEAEAAWNRNDRAAAAEPLREAARIYRGDLFAESPYEEIVVPEREQLREHFLRGLLRLVDLDAEAERWEEIVPRCRQGLRVDPWREELHAHLVRAHARLGHRAEALADYQRYEERMVGELGLLPSARMKALADTIASPPTPPARRRPAG